MVKTFGFICSKCDVINKTDSKNPRICVSCGTLNQVSNRVLKRYKYRGRILTASQHAEILGISADSFRRRIDIKVV